MTYIPEALRREINKAAHSRCEYCRLHENDAYFTHEIDHHYLFFNPFEYSKASQDI